MPKRRTFSAYGLSGVVFGQPSMGVWPQNSNIEEGQSATANGANTTGPGKGLGAQTLNLMPLFMKPSSHEGRPSLPS